MSIEVDEGAELDLFHRIAAKRREIMRLEGIAHDSAAQARADKDELRKAQRELAGLLDETIADRPLLRQMEAGPRKNGFPEGDDPVPPDGDQWHRDMESLRERVAAGGNREAATTPESAAEKPAKPYGWEVTYETHRGEEKQVHFVGSEATAQRKAMLKTGAKAIVKTTPFTEKQYVNAFGRGRM